MPNKLFVGSLSWDTKDDGLRAAFEKFGTITEAKVISDQATGRSRGFGFVTFTDDASAEKAKAASTGRCWTAARSRSTTRASARWRPWRRRQGPLLARRSDIPGHV